MFQMRRDGSEHLQQHYMLAVGLHAVEMLGLPLCGAQSHSVERRESIKDLGHMDTTKAAPTTHRKGTFLSVQGVSRQSRFHCRQTTALKFHLTDNIFLMYGYI